MKRFILVLVLFFPSLWSSAQKLSSANFVLAKQGREIRLIKLMLDDKFEVMITASGKIKIRDSDGFPIQNPSDIGLKLEYYSDVDIHDEKGKLKSIGPIVFKYNNAFDIHEQSGTLKSVGDIKINYYNAFDIHDPKGRIKSIDNVQIKYYNAFDINDRFGEIKSISGNTEMCSVSAGR